ncbi:MAG: hypothetical protein QOC76_4235 [Mycobacterium sp.]|jgi:hypothetical protein|nr:hypothetical protein [Mycobacterium sp.]
MAAPAVTTTPTTAERIRSTCASAGAAMLAIEGVEPTASAVHHLLDEGSFAITVPVEGGLSPASAAGVPAVLEMTDYAPLPLREPVRSLVWIRGRVQAVPDTEITGLLGLVAAADPNPALLQVNTTDTAGGDTRLTLVRLEVESVVVADSTGAEAVGVSALLQARPDPFCGMESCWLQHLEAAHRDVIDRLADRLPTTLRRGRVRPLGLDRYGVRLRVENDEGDHDVRLAFARPVDDVTGLSQAIRILMGCPFLNGLRARRPLP